MMKSFLFEKTNEISTVDNIRDVLKLKGNAYFPNEFGTKLKRWSSSKKNNIKTLSLFSGAGGLDIGFHDAGFHITSMIEIDGRFVKTLEANSGNDKYFPETKIICGDICNFIPSDNTKIDFIIGGPPCQTFSAAGRRAEGVQGTTEKRGQLFEEYVRILKQLSPKGFLFENVYGITGAENGTAWKKITSAFQEAGYTINYRILDAADYGVPQHRERAFIIGIKDGAFLFPRPIMGPDSNGNEPHVSASNAISGFRNKEELKYGLNGRYGPLLDDIPPGLNYSFYTDKMGHPCPIFAWRSKFSDFLYKAAPDRPVRTLKAQGGQYTGPFHWDNRTFTMGEMKRLQTFPDDYEIVGNRQVTMHQIGNSVPPQLARVLALAILNQVFNVKLPFELPLLKYTEQLGFRSRKRGLTRIYQQKAKDAIESLRKIGQKRFVGIKNYRVSLMDNFRLKKESQGVFYVEFTAESNSWNISISESKRIQNTAFQIIIEQQNNADWGFPLEKIVLCSDCLDIKAFTTLWKTLEFELIEQNLKADIVQLCGYYQYKPSFKCKMKFLKKKDAQNKNWQIINSVVSGIGIRKTSEITEFSNIWGVLEEEVFDYAVMLKQAGYEIRNSLTNPQINKEHLLIPYAFPTLNPQSVQLKKTLEPAYVK